MLIVQNDESHERYHQSPFLRISRFESRTKIKSDVAEEQCGFVELKGKTSAIYKLRTIILQALEVQKGVYLFFISYTKAFERFLHDEIITQLTQLEIDW